ncbi:hypothetical protein HK104_011216 [Borealophlyctis nickersoniae]|nr:hypothetical protein HK104_011216 [Borealophlyctis nickersoniae]
MPKTFEQAAKRLYLALSDSVSSALKHSRNNNRPVPPDPASTDALPLAPHHGTPQRLSSHHLPTELLRHIFRFLLSTLDPAARTRAFATCTLVSKTWNATATEFLWGDVCLWSKGVAAKFLTCRNASIGGAVARAGKLRRVEYHQWDPDATIINALVLMAPRLRVLEVEFIHVETMRDVFGACPNLVSFSARDFGFRNGGNEMMVGQGFASDPMLTSGFAKLKALSLGIRPTVTNLIARVAYSVAAPLEHLTLSRRSIPLETLDRIMPLFARNCPNLKLFHCKAVDLNDNHVASLLAGCKNLSQIFLHSIVISPTTITTIATRFPNLKGLGFPLSGSTYPALKQLATNGPYLHALHIPSGGFAAGHADDESTLVDLIFSRGAQLRQLDISGGHFLIDRTLECLANHAKDLERLALVGCSQLTERGFRALLKGCRKLKVIYCEEELAGRLRKMFGRNLEKRGLQLVWRRRFKLVPLMPSSTEWTGL